MRAARLETMRSTAPISRRFRRSIIAISKSSDCSKTWPKMA